MSCLSVSIIFALPAPRAEAQSSTLYALRFEGSWSATTHPMNFPGNPHFSGLIGVTHNNNVLFWSDGTPATSGIKNMAETGSKTELRKEFITAINAGTGYRIISDGGIGKSPGSISISFRIDEAHPVLTLVSMLAPSPDWFVGVSGLLLRDGGGWIDQITVDLFAWDAGTDGGASYVSTNQPIVPPVPIRRLTDPPMLILGAIPPVGRFVIMHTPVVSAEGTPKTPETALSATVFPNPISNVGTLKIVVDSPGNISVAVFDLQGREIQQVFRGFLESGSHLIPLQAGTVSQGVYMLRLTSRSGAVTTKLVVLK